MIELTEQETFDKVAVHLLKQNAKSMTDDGCTYRGYQGRSCAVGCLIPDELYLDTMDNPNDYPQGNSTVESLNANFHLFPNQLIPLLISLQEVHDYNDVEFWKGELSKVAEKHMISDSVLNDF